MINRHRIDYNFTHLIRITAWCLKWFKHSPEKGSILLSNELREAQLKIVKLDQSQFFNLEIESLLKNGHLSKRNRLIRLNPFIDSIGLLRSGGRLEKCPFLSYDQKFPLILAKNSHLSVLIAFVICTCILYMGGFN